jgi:hypothetical protein
MYLLSVRVPLLDYSFYFFSRLLLVIRFTGTNGCNHVYSMIIAEWKEKQEG